MGLKHARRRTAAEHTACDPQLATATLRAASVVSTVSYLNPARVLLATLRPIDIVTGASSHLLVKAWTTGQPPASGACCVCQTYVYLPDLWDRVCVQ